MSESEDEVQFVHKQKIVHYGSLEEEERRRLEAHSQNNSESDDSDDSGDRNGSDGHSGEGPGSAAEYLALEEERMSREKQLLLDELERKKRARKLNVPTDDGQVKSILREIGHPICFFGEGPADRRERLRNILAKDETVTAL
ncbi:U4/U6 small nuclear ribonucleoprotein Prp4-like, partial [Tropilaelaps mercedesae]